MPRIEIEWTPEDGNIASAYNVYYRVKTTESGGWSRVASNVSNRTTLDTTYTHDVLQFAVAPIVGGIEANEEDWTVEEIRPADTGVIDVPDDVTSFAIGQVGNLLACRWDAVSPAPDHYELRSGSSWDAGTVVQKPAGSAKSTSFGWGTSGSQTYMLKAVDAQGNKSANATSATVNVQASQYEVTKATTDEHSGGYTGTKSGTAVESGDLFLEKAPTLAQGWTDNADTYTWPPMFPHKSSGTYVTAADDAGSVVYEKIDVNLTLAKVDPTIYAKDWQTILRPKGNVKADSRTPLDRIYAAETLVDGYEYTIEIDTTPDDPAGTPTWDGWRIWVPEAVYRYRGVRLRITLISRWLWWFKLTGFTWKRRRENRKDEQTVVVSVTGGTAVTWSTTFTEAPNVTATPLYSTTPLMAMVASITTSGCDVYLFDAGGVERSSGTVYLVAAGV